MKKENLGSVKSLKKQLGAAVAMVCVAAVALGSSTYAWFVSNNQVTADVGNITAQSNAAFLQIDNKTNITADSTSTTIDNLNATLYPVRPVADTIAKGKKASEITWETSYAKKSDAALSTGKYYGVTEPETNGYIKTTSVFVNTSQGAFTNLKVDSVDVSAVTDGAEIVGAVGVLFTCGDNWELWTNQVTYVNGSEAKWTKKAASENALAASVNNTAVEVKVTVFYDGDYGTIFTDNLPNLHDAKINFALSATPNVAGVAGDDYQNGFTK